MKTSEVPVLIAGGGAAGTVLSLELARRGVEFRTIDRQPEPAPTSRAISVHARTLELLECIDKDLARRFLDRGIHNKGYIMHFIKDGQRSEVRPGLDFTTLDSSYPYILIHRQCETEEFIRDYIREQFAIEHDWGVKLVDIEQDATGVLATLVHGEDERNIEQVRCRYLVACDGINSRVRRSLNLAQEESDYAGTVLQNLDAYLEGFPDVDDYVHYCAGKDHFVMVVLLPGGFYRMLLSDRGEAADPGITPEQGFQNVIDQHFDNVRIGEVVWHSRWQSWVKLAETYRQGNIFLAGDSAHVHSTTGGQGMNCCMQDAFNLGWKLAMVAKGQAVESLLDSYVAERRPIAEQVIWAASSLHEIFMGHGKDISERSERLKDTAFLDDVIGRCSGISYTYRDYVGSADLPEVVPGPTMGDRAPDAGLGSNRNLFDLLRHPGFTLLGIKGETSRADTGLDAITSQIASPYQDLIRHAVLDPGPQLVQKYGNDTRDRLFLVRPDGYIGYRCFAEQADGLKNYLGNLLKQA